MIKPRIAVIGLGGVGGYLGSRLAKTYGGQKDCEIIFLQRGEHLRAIRRHGLAYITPYHEYRVFPDLTTDRMEDVGELDIVLFCVKSYDLESSARMVRGHLKSVSLLIPVLNGIDIHKRLELEIPGCLILPACIYISARIEKPGVVRQTGGAGRFFFGPLDGRINAYRDLEKFFIDARIKAGLVSNIRQRIWEKFVFVSPLAALTALSNRPIGAVTEDPENRKLISGLIDELRRIAEYQDVKLAEDIESEFWERIHRIPYDTPTSLQLDFNGRKKTELDVFTGYVVAQGREMGIATPLHDMLYARLLIRLRDGHR